MRTAPKPTPWASAAHRQAVGLGGLLPSTYEILDPADFGLTRYVHIAHRLTGWNAVKSRAEQLGLALTDDDLKEATAHIKALADVKPMALEDVDAVLRAWHQKIPIVRIPNPNSEIGNPNRVTA